MNHLSIDFETRSVCDLRRTNVYVYAEDPTTEILCMAYAFGDEPVEAWMPGEPMPERIAAWVKAEGPMRAYNAMFERVIWNLILTRHGLPRTTREQWYCTAAEAAAMALPRGLGKVARVLNVPTPKDDEGHRLMLQMCKPRSVDETALGSSEITWWDDPERMARLVDYCRTDVAAEREVAKRIRRLGKTERKVYLLDQKMNDRGVRVDLGLVAKLQVLVKAGQKEANARLKELTGGEVTRVTKVADLTAWLQEQGLDVEDIRKATIRDRLANGQEWADDVVDADVVQEVLETRKEAAKSSTAKLNAMKRTASPDGRIRGMLNYHGAGTGRWSGRGAQPQNYPRGEVPNIEWHIPFVQAEAPYDFEGHPPLGVASAMLRSCFIASPGREFIAGDYSQIEARVLGWFADEPYGDREYERMAAAIYGVPLEQIKNPSERRTVGKNTVLGCGYQMGAATFEKQIWEQTGLRVGSELAERAVRTYRTLKPGIPDFWRELEDAAMGAVQRPGQITYAGKNQSIRWVVRGEYLVCILPSGRPLFYALPRVKQRMTQWGAKWGLEFTGVNGYTKRWETRHAYGGFLTENIVQATARDIMVEGMFRLEDAGYPCILTVHDEILTEPPAGRGSVEEFESLMAQEPAWLPGCPIAVEAWRGERYKK